MQQTPQQLWERFKQHYLELPELGIRLDVSRMRFADDYFARMESRMNAAFQEMDALEKGALANPDEKRMVGHYWLRNPALAPTPEIRNDIESTIAAIKDFARAVHQGQVRGKAGPFDNLLVIGIGGSALGPQFVSQALTRPSKTPLAIHFFDNTDPDGMDRVLEALQGRLGTTLTLVISKSGGTKETRNGMLEAAHGYQRAGLDFAQHAVAITGDGSELDRHAASQGWLRRFPMWDWVGGRTSETSAVGLLPAALQGFDIDAVLTGARAMDVATRQKSVANNPAALLSLMWFHSGNGKGEKGMVVLPYKDRFELLSKYLQQLVMESIGKETDRSGRFVNQGIAVYGNKGSTDQHAYVQQLREGLPNFFVTFVEVLRDRDSESIQVDAGGITSGDYLSGFLLGTREALWEKDRESITLTVDRADARTVGALIALFERAVGFYASLIDVNAYHQPGVEAGKKAASRIIDLQLRIQDLLRTRGPDGLPIEELFEQLGPAVDREAVYKICRHLAANPSSRVQEHRRGGPFDVRYSIA